MKKYSSFFKSIAIVLILQAAIYFIIKIFQSNYNVITSILDFPFIKGFVYFYDSWYPFIVFNAFLIYYFDKDNYKSLIFTMIFGAFLAHITFLIYPTMIDRPSIIVNNITDFILNFTYETDTPAVNCLPSVHCLFCFIMMYYTFISKKIKNSIKIPVISYLILIVLSTLFIRQHIIEDAILSLIYTIIVIINVYIFRDKLVKYLKFLF